ncbi:hypothetical protein M1145_01760 [Patescibacteria group bacterium]|nr:hypothetical protein [Patescibacteria group bacterium]
MIIDTHAHITKEFFGDKIEEIVKESKENNISKIIVPSISLNMEDNEYKDYLY